MDKIWLSCHKVQTKLNRTQVILKPRVSYVGRIILTPTHKNLLFVLSFQAIQKSQTLKMCFSTQLSHVW